MAYPASTPPLGDAQLAAFRQKAGPILAEARGLTPAALAKLAEIARELGLEDEQVDAAIRSLHAGPAKPRDPAVEKFRARLKKDLSVKKKTIIGPEIEARIIAGGSQKYALAEPVILEVLAEVAAELGLRRITGDEALAHFVEMVDAAVGDSTWLARQAWDRLRMASEKWGLTFEEADQVIQQKLDANRRASFRGKLLGWTITYGAIGVVACVLVTLAVLTMRRKNDPVTSEPSGPGTVAPARDEIRPPVVKGPPEWWGVELALEVSSARREIPGVSEIHDRLVSDTPAVRGAAYGELIALGAKMTPGSGSRGKLAEIITLSHAREPAEEAAHELRTALLALIPSHVTPPSAGTTLYERAFWGVGIARSALLERDLPSERRKALAAALSSTLGIPIAPDAGEEELKTKCDAALSLLLFQHLISLAAQHPASAPALHEYLMEQGRLPDSAEEIEPLEASYLAALLPAAEATWRDHQSLVTRLVRSKNPLVTLRMADLMTRVRDRGLQSLLAEELVKHTGARPRTSDPRDIARAVRQALGAAGVSSAQSQEDRWEILRLEANAALAPRAPLEDNYTELLKQTLELSRLATLASALSQSESGVPVFDELMTPKKPAEPIPDGDPFGEKGTPAAPRPRPLTNREKQQLEQYVATLRTYQDQNPIARTGSFHALAHVAPLVSDLNYEQAAAVARYLLAEKSPAEQEAIQPAVQAVRRWKQLRLAVADQIEDSKLPAAQVQELVQSLLDDAALALSSDRPALRRSLLISVHGELGSETSGDAASPKNSAAEQTAKQLADYYRARSRLAGVSSADLAAAQTPGQVLELLVTAVAKGREGFPERLAVAHFLGTSDLRKTVLLQRLLIEGAVQRIAILRPRQAEAAALVLADLKTADANAANLLVQLYHGEAATLKLGMLYGEN